MARVAPRTTSSSALYEYLRDVFEHEARQLVHRPAVDEHLAAMQARQPVDVQLADLPAWAREGQALHYWRRAIVTITGTVDFYDGTALQWLEDHGL